MEDPRCFHHYSTTTISPHLFARSLENKRSRISRWILIQRSPGIESALDYRAMYCIPDSKVETEGRGSVLIPERLAFYCCYYYCYRWLRRIWMSKSEISKIFSPFFSLLSFSLSFRFFAASLPFFDDRRTRVARHIKTLIERGRENIQAFPIFI